MQIHGPSAEVEKIDVRLNPGSRRPFAVVDLGGADLFIESVADADKLIKAAVAAKDLLLGEDTWAVRDSQEGEVAGPMTRADAEVWARDSRPFFAGTLTVEPAAPELDAKLSPPAPGTLSDAERDEAVMPPGHQLPAGDVPGNGIVCAQWDEPLPPFHATGHGASSCSAECGGDYGYICTAQEGHAGPLHIAYGTDSEICHTWPADAGVPAGTDAR